MTAWRVLLGSLSCVYFALALFAYPVDATKAHALMNTGVIFLIWLELDSIGK